MNARPFDRLYSIVLLTMLLGYAVVLPAFQAPDEIAHFWRAFDFSQNHCSPTPDEIVPTDYLRDSAEFHPWLERDEGFIRGRLLQREVSAVQRPRSASRTPYSIHAVDLYSCMLYVPQAAGVVIALATKLSLLGAMYLGRIFTAITVFVLLIAGYKRMPFARPLYVALSLLPMSLQQSASLSADALTLATAFLATAILLRVAYRHRNARLGRWSYIGLAALAVVLGSGKTNVLLLGLGVLIPAVRFGGSLRKAAVLVTLACIGLATNITTILLNQKVAGSSPIPSSAIQPRINFVVTLHDPTIGLAAIVHTLRTLYVGYLQEIVGTFGWLSFPLPKPAIVFAVTLLVFVALSTRLPSKSAALRVTSVSVAFASVLVVFALGLITQVDTAAFIHPTGPIVIPGVQGRYFLTALLPIGLAISLPGRLAERHLRLVSIIGSAVSALIGLAYLFVSFYT